MADTPMTPKQEIKKLAQDLKASLLKFKGKVGDYALTNDLPVDEAREKITKCSTAITEVVESITVPRGPQTPKSPEERNRPAPKTEGYVATESPKQTLS
jgi:hypothetical protein